MIGSMTRAIVPLGPEHTAALQRYLAEWGDEEIPGYFCERDWPHERCVHKLAAWARGEELPERWQPCVTSFLVEHGEILGNSNFRPVLDEFLSRYGGNLGYAVRPSARRRGVATALVAHAARQGRARGLDRLVVTCAPDNVGSIGAILRNGGVLQEQYWHERFERDVNLYWIDLR